MYKPPLSSHVTPRKAVSARITHLPSTIYRLPFYLPRERQQRMQNNAIDHKTTIGRSGDRSITQAMANIRLVNWWKMHRHWRENDGNESKTDGIFQDFIRKYLPRIYKFTLYFEERLSRKLIRVAFYQN